MFFLKCALKEKSLGTSDLQRVPYSKRALFVESIVYIASVFKVLQSCDAGRHDGKFYVTDHFSGAISSCHKASAVICTSLQRSNQNVKVHAAQRLVCIIASLFFRN